MHHRPEEHLVVVVLRKMAVASLVGFEVVLEDVHFLKMAVNGKNSLLRELQ